MCENIFYDGTKLLSLKDINGERPEIFICTSNRNAGKTTYFNRLCVNKFIKNNEKFCLVYRWSYELDDCANKFFKDINGLFFPEYKMTNQERSNGIYHELFLNETPCGYALALNNADNIKKISHLLSDTVRMLFDEFQSETSHYCSKEILKLQSIHTSIARGNHQQVRYVPLIMISNPVSIINPYYCAMGISSRLRNNTKFLKGDGWVLEQGYNESASLANKASGFNRAFAGNEYQSYASEGVYLNDNVAFIDKPKTKGYYLCTLKCEGAYYGIREFPDEGIVYCDSKPDLTFPRKIAVTTDDHQINYVMLKRNSNFIKILKDYFMHGSFRFKDLKSKDAVMKALSF